MTLQILLKEANSPQIRKVETVQATITHHAAPPAPAKEELEYDTQGGMQVSYSETAQEDRPDKRKISGAADPSEHSDSDEAAATTGAKKGKARVEDPIEILSS